MQVKMLISSQLCLLCRAKTKSQSTYRRN